MTRAPAPDALLQHRNLRDLGGLATRRRGSVVAPGRFFRSSSPSRFELEEQRALSSLGLRSIVDLRTSAECARDETANFSTEVRVVHLPLFESARPHWIAPTDQSSGATADRYLEMLQAGLPALAAVVVHVARPEANPFVVSCTAGRDRTGIVVACLLDLLDVTDEAIAMDYARSDAFARETGRAHPATILELLSHVRDRYGSTERMLAPLGVTSSIVESLRQELL